MKTVFASIEQCAHVWAQQTQTEGRAASVSFYGPVFNSYRTAIGAIVKPFDGSESVLLVNARKYSATTSSKHTPAMRRAFRGRMFTVSDIGSITDHAANLVELFTNYERAIGKAKSARSFDSYTRDSLRTLASDANSYAECFNLGQPIQRVDLDATLASIVAHHIERTARNDTPAKRAKRERNAAAKLAREVEAKRIASLNYARKLEEWRNGANVYFGYNNGRDVALRIVGEELQTSMGARVPLVHAIRVFKFVKLCRETATAWTSNGRTLRVGHFQVDAVANNGSFTAGCHLIEWEEIERVARAAGVFNETATADVLENSHA